MGKGHKHITPPARNIPRRNTESAHWHLEVSGSTAPLEDTAVEAGLPGLSLGVTIYRLLDLRQVKLAKPLFSVKQGQRYLPAGLS